MSHVLLTAVVTTAWVLVEGLVGRLWLGRRGRPYRTPAVVIHIVLFLPVAAGWFFTVQGLLAAPGDHVGSWIAQVLMGLAAVGLLVSGSVLTAGRKVPSPRGPVVSHWIAIALTLLGSVAGIVCMLSGV